METLGMQEVSVGLKGSEIQKDPSVANILSELMRDQLLEIVRTSEMKSLKVIEKYIDGKVLKAVLDFVKSKKTCETFDVIDNLDHDPKEICKILDFLDAIGKIKIDKYY